MRALGTMSPLQLISLWPCHCVVTNPRSDMYCLTKMSYKCRLIHCYSGSSKETDVFSGPVPVTLPEISSAEGQTAGSSWAGTDTTPAPGFVWTRRLTGFGGEHTVLGRPTCTCSVCSFFNLLALSKPGLLSPFSQVRERKFRVLR